MSSNVLRTFYKLLTGFLRTSYKLKTGFLWTSYKHQMKFIWIWTSCELLTTFLWTCNELFMSFLHVSYKHCRPIMITLKALLFYNAGYYHCKNNLKTFDINIFWSRFVNTHQPTCLSSLFLISLNESTYNKRMPQCKQLL